LISKFVKNFMKITTPVFFFTICLFASNLFAGSGALGLHHRVVHGAHHPELSAPPRVSSWSLSDEVKARFESTGGAAPIAFDLHKVAWDIFGSEIKAADIRVVGIEPCLINLNRRAPTRLYSLAAFQAPMNRDAPGREDSTSPAICLAYRVVGRPETDFQALVFDSTRRLFERYIPTMQLMVQGSLGESMPRIPATNDGNEIVERIVKVKRTSSYVTLPDSSKLFVRVVGHIVQAVIEPAAKDLLLPAWPYCHDSLIGKASRLYPKRTFVLPEPLCPESEKVLDKLKLYADLTSKLPLSDYWKSTILKDVSEPTDVPNGMWSIAPLKMELLEFGLIDEATVAQVDYIYNMASAVCRADSTLLAWHGYRPDPEAPSRPAADVALESKLAVGY
jgi:hypothetical protein